MIEIRLLENEQKLSKSFLSVSNSSLSNISLSSKKSDQRNTFLNKSESEYLHESKTSPTKVPENQKMKKSTKIGKFYDNAKDFVYLFHLRSIDKKKRLDKTSTEKINNEMPELNFTKKELLKMDKLDRFQVKKWLDDELSKFMNDIRTSLNKPTEQVNDNSFLETNDVSKKTYFHLAAYATNLLEECEISSEKLLKYAHLFDFSESIKGNGYRLVVRNYDSCCRHLLLLLIELNEKRTGIMFQMTLFSQNVKLNNDLKELQAWVSCFKL